MHMDIYTQLHICILYIHMDVEYVYTKYIHIYIHILICIYAYVYIHRLISILQPVFVKLPPRKEDSSHQACRGFDVSFQHAGALYLPPINPKEPETPFKEPQVIETVTRFTS